jgi:hypothetical protein
MDVAFSWRTLDSLRRVVTRISQMCLPNPRRRQLSSAAVCADDARAARTQVSVKIEDRKLEK